MNLKVMHSLGGVIVAAGLVLPAAAQDQAGSSDAVSTHYRANRGVGAHYD